MLATYPYSLRHAVHETQPLSHHVTQAPSDSVEDLRTIIARRCETIQLNDTPTVPSHPDGTRHDLSSMISAVIKV
jgi:hypothetical protein